MVSPLASTRAASSGDSASYLMSTSSCVWFPLCSAVVSFSFRMFEDDDEEDGAAEEEDTTTELQMAITVKKSFTVASSHRLDISSGSRATLSSWRGKRRNTNSKQMPHKLPKLTYRRFWKVHFIIRLLGVTHRWRLPKVHFHFFCHTCCCCLLYFL